MASARVLEIAMMATYDLLAPLYDAVTGDSSTEAALIRDILERRHGRVATLLDVACGTGAITVPLSRAYQVSGLDIAPGMLAVARGKLPGDVPLYVADMTSFTLSTRFDAIVCAYQGVNHLPSLPKVVEQFGDNYLQLTVSTTDGARFRWHIEVFELQPDGRYRLLTQVVEMRSFPVDQVTEALCRRFTDVEVIGGDDRSADQESGGRIWLACARPS